MARNYLQGEINKTFIFCRSDGWDLKFNFQNVEMPPESESELVYFVRCTCRPVVNQWGCGAHNKHVNCKIK